MDALTTIRHALHRDVAALEPQQRNAWAHDHEDGQTQASQDRGGFRHTAGKEPDPHVVSHRVEMLRLEAHPSRNPVGQRPSGERTVAGRDEREDDEPG
jgi:hypothetical protein